ncbi:hypothetical protein [Domibacillus mangrovi]|uniref:Uncharacterized protein n=1 Tax=Domibacillus mangrovi TaxID=1714354 RepID=A0A1Q5P4A5_9BACI|nr:hypothetical protein [Domibacillus mangrovi]OKL37013.1 hypothetical protein BLL40_05320 [Domibacillus mangrovi]
MISSLAAMIFLLALIRIDINIPSIFIVGCAIFAFFMVSADFFQFFCTLKINPQNNTRIQKFILSNSAMIRDGIIAFSFPMSLTISLIILQKGRDFITATSDVVTLMALGLTLLLISIRE